MKIIPIEKIEGAYVVEVDRYHDDRGYFQEHFNETKYSDITSKCSQVSFSQSKENVDEGLFIYPYVLGKLIQCVRDDQLVQVFVPGGCGHGIFSYQENSLIVYAQEGCFSPEKEINLNPFDEELQLPWPVVDPLGKGARIVSEKDRNAPRLKELIEKL